MKLHDFAGAPNPKKVRVYLAEKGLKVYVFAEDVAASGGYWISMSADARSALTRAHWNVTRLTRARALASAPSSLIVESSRVTRAGFWTPSLSI